MSMITDMVLFTERCDDDAVARLNAWCAVHDNERHQQFRKLNTDTAGGTKVFTSDVWAMAGNYFHHLELAAALPSFGWKWPGHVVLIANDENDTDNASVFRVGVEAAS